VVSDCDFIVWKKKKEKEREKGKSVKSLLLIQTGIISIADERFSEILEKRLVQKKKKRKKFYPDKKLLS